MHATKTIAYQQIDLLIQLSLFIVSSSDSATGEEENQREATKWTL